MLSAAAEKSATCSTLSKASSLRRAPTNDGQASSTDTAFTLYDSRLQPFIIAAALSTNCCRPAT